MLKRLQVRFRDFITVVSPMSPALHAASKEKLCVGRRSHCDLIKFQFIVLNTAKCSKIGFLHSNIEAHAFITSIISGAVLATAPSCVDALLLQSWLQQDYLE
jgi:hypothetical protein